VKWVEGGNIGVGQELGTEKDSGLHRLHGCLEVQKVGRNKGARRCPLLASFGALDSDEKETAPEGGPVERSFRKKDAGGAAALLWNDI